MTDPAPLDPRSLTWASLLARWTEFAKSSLALPKDRDGTRFRAAVPDIIALQAVTHALSEIDLLTQEGERALAIDRAEIQVRSHGGNLHTIWKDEPLHEGLVELIRDARAAIDEARGAGLEWCVDEDCELVAEHPAALIEALLDAGCTGTLFVPTPGVPLFAGSPAVFLHAPGGALPNTAWCDVIESAEFAESLNPDSRRGSMRQVYRQFDFAVGKAVRDLVVPMSKGLPGGQPLLVCAIEKGEPQGVTLPPRRGPLQEPLPVEFAQDADASA